MPRMRSKVKFIGGEQVTVVLYGTGIPWSIWTRIQLMDKGRINIHLKKNLLNSKTRRVCRFLCNLAGDCYLLALFL